MTQTEALKMALKALEEIYVGNMTPMAEANWNKAITAIKEVFAQLEQEPVACDSEMKAQAKRAYPHDEKRELAFIDGWLSRDATQQQNFVAIDWGAVHNKLMDVWYRELSADEGLDEIQGLINTTPPPVAEPHKRKPLTNASAQFNAAIDFAIQQGSEAGAFLRSWREGDTSEWPEFEAAHGIKE